MTRLSFEACMNPASPVLSFSTLKKCKDDYHTDDFIHQFIHSFLKTRGFSIEKTEFTKVEKRLLKTNKKSTAYDGIEDHKKRAGFNGIFLKMHRDKKLKVMEVCNEDIKSHFKKKVSDTGTAMTISAGIEHSSGAIFITENSDPINYYSSQGVATFNLNRSSDCRFIEKYLWNTYDVSWKKDEETTISQTDALIQEVLNRFSTIVIEDRRIFENKFDTLERWSKCITNHNDASKLSVTIIGWETPGIAKGSQSKIMRAINLIDKNVQSFRWEAIRSSHPGKNMIHARHCWTPLLVVSHDLGNQQERNVGNPDDKIDQNSCLIHTRSNQYRSERYQTLKQFLA